MATRQVHSHVDRFAGLSDRSIAVQNTRIESPDLLNVDFSERAVKVRPGFSRLNSTAFKDCAVLLDGYNDFGQIVGMTSLSANDTPAWAVEIKLMQMPVAAVTILDRGFTAGGPVYSTHFQLVQYDPTLNGNLGGWACYAYDATAAAWRTMTVNDGDAAKSHVGSPRHLEFYRSSTGPNVYTFRVRDGAGTEIGSATATIATWATVTSNWFIGVSPTVASSGATAPAAGDSTYASIALAGLRFYNGASATIVSEVQITGREQRSYTGELATALEYFPITEGTGNISDSTATNTAGAEIHWGANTPAWVTDASLCVGTSALRFYGEDGEVIWRMASGSGQTIFTDNATGFRKWLVSFIYVPILAPGENDLRPRTLIWWGTSTTVPAPLGITVNATNQIVITYRDGSATQTTTLSTNLLPYVNKRVRINVSYNDQTADTITLVLHPEGVTSSFPATTLSVNATDPSNITTSAEGNDVCIGRKCTSFTYPYTFGDQALYGIIDDVVIFKDQYAAAGPGPVVLPPTNLAPTPGEVTISNVVSGGTPFFPSNQIQLMAGLRLNDGDGNNLTTIGSLTSSAYLFPERDDGLWWTNGWLTLADPPEIDLVAEYSRVGPLGALNREYLVLCGGGLWGYDVEAGTINARGFIPKGRGKASYTQYGSIAYIGRSNGYRPFRVDGLSCYELGIRAPILAPTLGQTTGGSLTLLATYQVYYTFRNPQTGVESNPSPVGSVTLTGSNNAITVTLIQRSSERQVGQRRIYVSAANAAAGSTMYLSATIEENRTTSASPIITVTALGTTPTLEYTDNKEAPTGSLVRVYKDRLWVAGVPLYPTRAYYSAIGNQEAYNQSTDYIDFDINSGDPITALGNLQDFLTVHLRDGRALVTSTGDTTTPFLVYKRSSSTGAVAHNAVVEVDQPTNLFDAKQGLQFAIADDKIYTWDGSGTDNITSPAGFDRPSIEYTFREKLNRDYTHLWTACEHPLRRQVLFGVSETNDTRVRAILVYDQAQGIWTRWRMDAEFLAKVDDANNVPAVVFGSHGYLCKLTDNAPDGVGTLVTRAISSAAAFAFSVNVNMTAEAYNGLHFHIISGPRAFEYRCIYNTVSTLYAEQLGDTSGASQGDIVVIGGFPLYVDFVMDWGSVLTLKRLRWIKAAGYASASTDLAFSYQADVLNRRTTITGATTVTGTLASTTPVVDMVAGGLARMIYVRLSPNEMSIHAGAGDYVAFPVSTFGWYLTEIDFEAEIVEAR